MTLNKTPRTCQLCKEPFYPVTTLEKRTSICNRCLWDMNIPNTAETSPESLEMARNLVVQANANKIIGGKNGKPTGNKELC